MDVGSMAAAGRGDVDRALFTMLEAEKQRYASFFATLEPSNGTVARAAALEFFNKSSLSDAEVEALYASVKSVGVVPDASVMNETEFILGMHLIVCLTKRGLAALPQPFPTYLFPTLSLPTASSNPPRHADLISGMPSPDKPIAGPTISTFGQSSLRTMGSTSTPRAVPAPPSSPLEVAKLVGSTSLAELADKEVQNNDAVQTQLAHVDESEAKTLEHLHSTLHALASAVEQLGVSVPPATHASIGAVDDLGNFLRANVQMIKQEIQSLEIAARMRSVADEATSRTNSLRGGEVPSPVAPPTGPSATVAQVATLAAQLAALQHEAAQLQNKKDALVRQLLDKKTAAQAIAAAPSPATATPVTPLVAVKAVIDSAPPSTSSSSMEIASSLGWGDFGASPATVAPPANPQETVGTASPDTFGFGAFEATTTETAKSQDTDFGGWGAFE